MTDKPDDAKDDLIWALAKKVGLHNAKELFDIIVAAGWSPPVESRLRAVETGHPGAPHRGLDDNPCECRGYGTLTRPLTQEEMVEVATEHVDYHVRALGHQGVTLLSGARVILVEEK